MKITAQEEYGLRCLLQLAKCSAEQGAFPHQAVSVIPGVPSPRACVPAVIDPRGHLTIGVSLVVLVLTALSGPATKL